MATVLDHIATLQAACELRDDEDFDRYLHAIAALRTRPSPEVLAAMLRCLRDVEGGEIQYELVGACEAYDEATYAREFARAAAEIRATAPWWGRLMFQSILNSNGVRRSLIDALASLSPEANEVCRDWATEIARDYERGNKYEKFARDLGVGG